MPYSGCNDMVAMSKALAGGFPQRHSDMIPGTIWAFLEKCWSRNPSKRPSTSQVYSALLQLQPLPPPTEVLPKEESSRGTPSPDWPEEPILGAAATHLDKIAEVIHLVISPYSSSYNSILETHAWESNAGVGKVCQASEPPSLWHGHSATPWGRRKGGKLFPAHL